MALFESYERREKQILEVLNKYGISSIEECADICKAKGFDPYKITEGIQRLFVLRIPSVFRFIVEPLAICPCPCFGRKFAQRENLVGYGFRSHDLERYLISCLWRSYGILNSR